MASGNAALDPANELFPDLDWAERPATDLGWSEAGLEVLGQELGRGNTTAFMMAQAGMLIYRWGDIALKSSVASVRKSLISAVYGMYIAEGVIDLNATLGDMGIDDTQPLTVEERTATVRDLLMARSGIYMPSVYDTGRGRPARGSHPPGAHFFYNNWDFNVLATIIERQTGITVFEALATRLAIPLGMQDVAPGDGSFHHGPESQHPVYKIRMSARDLARVGLLYLREGRWATRQLVPENWVRESTMLHSEVGAGHGYGYLWWSSAANAPGDSMCTHLPMFYASGFGGQYVIVLPALELVVVHRSAPVLRAGDGVSHARIGDILRLALAAASG
jgi:CubicO group peptidase (beta-lactamase class C family)